MMSVSFALADLNSNFKHFPVLYNCRVKVVKTKETAKGVTTKRLPKAKQAIARQPRKLMVLPLSYVTFHRGYTLQWKSIERYITSLPTICDSAVCHNIYTFVDF